jgi:hypothetical protein
VLEALALAVHRFVLRTQRGPLGSLWGLGYALVIRAVAFLLTLGQPASAYLRGSFGYGDVIYGLSDIDISIVVADSAGAGAGRRLRRRWRRLCRVVPGLRHLVQVAVYEEAELVRAASAPTLTAAEAVHLGRPPRDDAYLRFRPGLFGPLCEWRSIQGRDRRPVPGPQDSHERRTAAWLELQRWWREAFFASAHPGGPRLPYVCVKLVAEPVRILLWLEHGERIGGRREVLERALRRMPEEEVLLRRALDLHAALPRSPHASLSQALASLVHLSGRLAGRLDTDAATQGSIPVRLVWGDESELVLPAGATDRLRALRIAEPALLPLCDWRARVWPAYPDDTLAPLPIDPGDETALGAAALAAGDWGPFPAIRQGSLLILPGPGLMRAVQCRMTDPVSFALLDERDTADFPDVLGWSAADSARRAVAEHRAWLGAERDSSRSAVEAWMEAQARTTQPNAFTLGRLLTAAQAALFLHSIDEGEPELPLTMAAVARGLRGHGAHAAAVAGDAYERYRQARGNGGQAPWREVLALREIVVGLPGYAFALPWRRRVPA